jgi:hypothetical protein
MGGAPALRRVARVRLEMMTQWQRVSFDERPYTDAPSYERHSELRDYTIPAWRNTRRFPAGKDWREMTDVVADTVAIRRAPAPGGTAAWAPLNVAYVDERRELFAFAPERVLLLARDARDLRALPDTSVGGVAHARVAATVDGFPATLLLRRGDGLLAMARYRAAQPNDFGLAPWGEMEVELWYSRWQPVPNGGGVAVPAQIDVRRVGRPYKRMTVLAAAVDTAAMPDSFAVSDSLRRAFVATARRPMYDVPLDSARLVGGTDGRFATFGPFGPPTGAVKVGRAWVLLEGGQAPLVTERAVRWLEGADSSARVAAAVVTAATAGNGGVAWLAGRRVPLVVAPAARPLVATMLRNQRQPPAAARAVAARGEWLRVGGDSIRVEPLDLPDAPGAMVVYAPSLRWAYSALAVGPMAVELVMKRARERGWIVEHVGSARALFPAVAPGA